jgi:hypothetical protein
MGKKLVTYAVIGFVVFFVATRPDAAARLTKWIGGALTGLANGFGNFFSGLV